MQEVTTLVKNLSLMNVRFSRRWLGMPLIFLLSLIITIGCTTVVTPLKPGAVTSLETPEETPDHGYVRGASASSVEWKAPNSGTVSL